MQRGKGYEELKKQTNMRSLKIVVRRRRKERKQQGTMHEQMDDERHEELLYESKSGLTCSSEHVRDDVRVIAKEWKHWTRSKMF